MRHIRLLNLSCVVLIRKTLVLLSIYNIRRRLAQKLAGKNRKDISSTMLNEITAVRQILIHRRGRRGSQSEKNFFLCVPLRPLR